MFSTPFFLHISSLPLDTGILRTAARAAARTARAAAAADELSRQRTGLNRFMNTLGLRYCAQRAEKQVAIATMICFPNNFQTIRVI